jgi:hypothetical protein
MQDATPSSLLLHQHHISLTLALVRRSRQAIIHPSCCIIVGISFSSLCLSSSPLQTYARRGWEIWRSTSVACITTRHVMYLCVRMYACMCRTRPPPVPFPFLGKDIYFFFFFFFFFASDSSLLSSFFVDRENDSIAHAGTDRDSASITCLILLALPLSISLTTGEHAARAPAPPGWQSDWLSLGCGND